MILLAVSSATSFTNDSIGVNSTSIVRSQLQSIADEVVDSTKFDIKARVAVLVEGEGNRTLAENAFIEAFQKRKFTFIVIDTTSVNQILNVFILNSEIKVREVNAKLFERIIRTTLEARIVKGAEREAHILGKFNREIKDTAQVFSEELLPAVQKENESGIFQRILTPFIVIGGTIVIVYLFFTVRS